ncbi:protein TIS11 [Contarinia nasturtii]|uniref:protein TIS11 n=1 Tax=Contarinia nasturtii TaxID=265458 RepID=UPI0012D46552|nr:protein TIS11 [Contarinia nasturtii]
MSTAIMSTGGVCWDYNKFHGDWNDSNDVADIQLKDQYSYGSIAHQQQPQSIGTNRVGAQTMRNSINGLHTLPNGVSMGSDAQLLQNQIAAIQQQQQQQQKMLHNALTRTISHQPTNSDLQLLQSNLDAITSSECHRKLERTQSEPAPQVNQQVNTSRYKTELCRPFKETGECKYGEKCQFAHGENELRTVQRHPKYKTEYCRTFYGVGLCPYGSRCHFLHDLSDDDNTRAQNNRANANRNESAAIPTANGRIAAHQNGFGRNITSAEVDAITKAARFIGTIKDEPMPMASHRTFGRSASLMNTNAIASIGGVHPLPMSPPLSMSTGSDRASPICSLSPTNSIASFPFTEQNSTFGVNNVNNLTNGIYSSHITPPASPPAMVTVTPPPTPILAAAGATKSIPINVNGISNAEKSRLPIFNQISCASTINTLKNLPL